MFNAPKTKEDEPFFTLLGRDPAAPHIVRAWAYRRIGQPTLAAVESSKADSIINQSEPQHSGDEQIRSAFNLADRMEAYQRQLMLGNLKADK